MIGYQDEVNLPQSAVGIALGSTGDKCVFKVPFRCEVVRVAAAIEGASAHATAAVIKFDKRPTAGSDTGRGDGDVGVLSKTASLAQGGKYLYEVPTSLIVLKPGEEVVGEVTTAQGEALAATLFVIGRPTPETMANETNAVAA